MNRIPSLGAVRRRQAGFSLVELMVSIAISLIMLVALAALFINVSSSNNELTKANGQIENGRFAVQVLEADLVHAGFWGQFVPQFDDLTWSEVPNDTPATVPDPCLAYSTTNWDFDYINSLIGIPVQSSDAAPGSCALSAQRANTDVLVVRHAANCVPGDTNCDADTAGKLYFQASQCAAGTAGTARAGTSTTISLALPTGGAPSSATDNAYAGMLIRTTGGAGAGQTRVISSYVGSTAVATVSVPWSTTPDATTTYAIVEDLLATSGFSEHKRGADCSTAATADKRKFVSTIYYVRDYAVSSGDGVPTLVRSVFDPTGAAALAHQAPEALVEGVERFAVELGIDDTVTRCGLNTTVDLTVAAASVDPTTCTVNTDTTANTLPTNRGDGNPDRFVRCTTAAPCTAAQLANVVAAKVYVLVRSTEATVGYTDSKTYCLATLPASGVCPPAQLAGPFNDSFKRHLFTSSVRLTSISGRRETP